MKNLERLCNTEVLTNDRQSESQRKRTEAMRLMYVFDYRKSSGYLCRVPEFLAKFICKRTKFHDYDSVLPVS